MKLYPIHSLFLLGFSLLIACDGDTAPNASRLSVAQKPEDARFRVGPSWLSSGFLKAASVESLESTRATQLVNDRLLALELRESQPIRASVSRKMILARAYLENAMAETPQEKPATEAELKQVQTRLNGVLSRPGLWRTVDARVPLELLKPQEEAFALANEIMVLTREATSLETFVNQARSVNTDLEFEFYRMPPISLEGKPYILAPGDYGLDGASKAYGAATDDCARNQPIPRVVGDEIGFHVIYCVEYLEGVQRTAEEQSRLNTLHLNALRAGAEVSHWIQGIREQVKVEIRPGAEALTQLAWEARVDE